MVGVVICVNSFGQMYAEEGAKKVKPQELVKAGAVSGVPDSLAAGQKLEVTLPFSTESGVTVAGYAVNALTACVPEECKNMKWELKKAVPETYNYYRIVPHVWIRPPLSGASQALKCVIDTTGWPGGDYKLSLQITIMKDGKDYYLSTDFMTTITTGK